MEESTAPAAPASEATPTTNPAPEAPAAAPQATAAPAAPTADIPADQIEAFNKFGNANGGFEKAFAKLKTDVSTPAQPQPAQPQQPEQPQQPIAPAQPAQPQRMPDGYISPEEFRAQQYFNGLSDLPEYASISKEIRNGDVFKEMAKFGIRPMQDGYINDGQIRDFLNLYAKTVPTQAPSAPVTNTPTVDYVNVGEQVTSRDDAIAIINQNRSLKPGTAPHPQTEAAKEFLKKYFNGEITK